MFLFWNKTRAQCQDEATRQARRDTDLVQPLGPGAGTGRRVHEEQAIHAIRSLQGKADQDVGTQADAEADDAAHGEVAAHILQLLSQLVHGRIARVGRQRRSTFLLTRRVHVQH